MGKKIIVVGAGIAGLAAGFRLAQAGHQISVLESSDRIGGRMSTVRRDGHVMDIGATALSTKYAQMLALAHEVGLAASIADSGDIIGIPRNGQMHRLRGSAFHAAATTKLLSWGEKLSALRLLPDIRRVASRMQWHDLGAAGEFDCETAAAWVARRADPELDHALFNAMMRGAYLASSSTMSVLDLHFLFNGFFGARLFTLKNGLGTLPEALARHVDLRLHTRVTHIEERAHGVRLSFIDSEQKEVCEDADHCIVAVPAPVVLDIYPQLLGEHQDILARTDYVPLITIKLALQRRPDESAMFIAIPEREHPVLGAIFVEHNKHADRAPAGRGQLGVFFDGAWNRERWDMDDAQLIAEAVKAAGSYFPGVERDLAFGEVFRWKHGVMNSRVGSYRALHQIAVARTAAKHVHLAGDYFGGPSVNAALASGEHSAQIVYRSTR